MRTIMSVALVLVLGSVMSAAAAEYNLGWSGSPTDGNVLKVYGFFVGPDSEANRGVHLFACDEADWDSCTVRIDLGEIAPDGDDGQVTMAFASIADAGEVTFFFVRGEDHLVHAPHIARFPGRPGQPTFN